MDAPALAATPSATVEAPDRTWLLAVSITSVQVGAGVAGGLMDDIGAAAVVMLRQGGAALVLLAVARPRLRGRSRASWGTVVAFGLVLAAMNCSFYAAVDRIPLGIAVTVELLGPLALAAALARRIVELVAVAAAVGGVALLGSASGAGGAVDPVGIAFALVAAAGWATYILLSRSAGRQADAMGTLALAMLVAAIVVMPVGVTAGGALVDPQVIGLGIVVALLAGVVPFSLELLALQHVPARVFGVLMSLSPVAATLSGFVLLGQRLGARQAIAMAVVMGASVATVRSAGTTT